ncbi:tripartite tricarboxylate transporter substrate binding protein [Allopusillimonas soli]|uniref:Tripartite tricarboxylate transporter substrate binding protein n=1 Tax=Allopusillimonas soli TaxID=659016 RepID=A0A853F7T9_9BURK|nr:tripartite tricarboxylate transporter substrate binding protein [Allopusillimonas soli]NYT35888.1 tripartite tricarboxylate transporter substrate binding protein [Allopusillimonas soli]TEA76251.1 tripartite tricarboxylate transporter substrate binding protein [Allopusillimonas soli]
MKPRLGHMLASVALAIPLMAGVAAPAHSAYPDKPLTLVVPFPPGGAVDTLGRLFADSISKQTGQSVIVENKAGANGNIGTEAVVRAPADGYTLLIAANGMATNPSLYTNRSFNEVDDLKRVAYLGYAPLILVVAYDSPFKSFNQLISEAKSKPGTISFATSGVGSAPHLATELLQIKTGTKLMHVPYKGGSPAKLDLVTGRVSLMFLNPLEAVPQVQAKKLRALVVDSPQRLPQLPDVPTAQELGYDGLQARVWWGFAVPAGTQDEVVNVLNKCINTALQDPQVKEKLDQMAVTTVGGSPQDFEKFYRDQVATWATVVKTAGISPQ